jgi:hypothetical protein
MTLDGYDKIHQVYKDDMPTTSVFQTLHSFGYYYGQSGGSTDPFVDVGVPVAALDDLYDSQNELGQALGDFFALYPRITYQPPAETETSVRGPDFGDGPLIGQTLEYYSYDVSNDVDYATLYDLECTGGDTAYASLNYNDWFPSRSEGFCDDLTPHYNAYEHDSISFDSSDTYKETAAGASRWYVVDGNQFQTNWTADISEDVTVHGTLPLAVTGDTDGITDDSNATCTVPLNIVAYQDGAVYAQASGLCPKIDVSNDGTYIIEVYSTDITQDVSCFSFMDNFFCGNAP